MTIAFFKEVVIFHNSKNFSLNSSIQDASTAQQYYTSVYQLS